MTSTGDVLRSVPLFSEFTDVELATLEAVGNQRDLSRNDVLFHEGDDSDALSVVITGRIAITRGVLDRHESVLALMERGDLIGEMGMFSPDGDLAAKRSADARALEPSRVLTIPYQPLRAIYKTRPELLWGVVTLLADRVRLMDVALADSMFLDVNGRTAKRLLELSNGENEFVLPITQEELAGMVGASRERVNKALAQFVRLGWLSQSDRHYVIIDRDALEQRAG